MTNQIPLEPEKIEDMPFTREEQIILTCLSHMRADMARMINENYFIFQKLIWKLKNEYEKITLTYPVYH